MSWINHLIIKCKVFCVSMVIRWRFLYEKKALPPRRQEKGYTFAEQDETETVTKLKKFSNRHLRFPDQGIGVTWTVSFSSLRCP